MSDLFLFRYSISASFTILACGIIVLSEYSRNRSISSSSKVEIIDNDITVEGLFERDKGICHLCGDKCNPKDFEIRDGYFIVGKNYPSIDHVKPRSKCGVHSWDNVKLAHHYCNTIKNNNENKEEVINKINKIKTMVFIT